jgi:DNA ligase-1
VRFAVLVDALERADATASRVETAQILGDALKQLEGDDLAFAVNFLLGQLGPAYEAVPVGIGDKNVVKVVAAISQLPEAKVVEEMQRVGDLGEVAAGWISRQRRLTEDPLELARVAFQMAAISTASGKGSGDRKLKLLQDLLASASPAEAKYLVRFLIGRMRVGIGEGTILEALAHAHGDRKRKGEVESAFNRHPDLALIARKMAAGGFASLAEVKVQPLVPLRPMLAERLKTLEEIVAKLGGRAALDYKYDGLRMQIHWRAGEVRIYSRNLEPYTEQFPDVVELVKAQAKAREFIVEGEGVTVDPETGEIRPFQEASRRRGRKYDLDAKAQEFPFVVFLFDCMYLDGEDLTARPYLERRKAAARAVTACEALNLSTMKEVTTPEEAEAFFLQALGEGCEGVIAKSVADDSAYRAGARGWAWIKFKRDYSAKLGDTVDLVVVGAFAGKGRRTGHYGSLLMAARDGDSDRFASVCKLATGFDDAQLAEFDTRLKPLARKERHPRVDSGLEADFWLDPQVVMEVRGAELTLSPVHRAAWGKVQEGAGLALRFPRFEKYREDKAAGDATTVEELVAMYRKQGGGAAGA